MLTNWGLWREYLLISDIVLMILLGQIAIVFIRYYFKNPESKVRFFFGVTFMAVTVGLAFQLVSTYYSDDPIFDKLYAIDLAIAIFFFCVNVEGAFGKLLRTRRLFTILTGIATIILFFAPDPSPLFEGVFFLVELMYMFPFFFFLVIAKVNQGIVRKKMLLAFIGFSLAMSGVGGTHERMQAILLGIVSFEEMVQVMIIFKGLMFVGLLILLFAFDVDIFLETDWKKYLEEFYIIEPASGTCLYHRNFLQDAPRDQSEKIFSSGIAGIVKLVQEFTKSQKNVDVIDEVSRKILLERGKQVTVAFVTKQDLAILRYYLRICLSEFEFYFGDLVSANMLGDSNLYSPMDIICNKILQLIPKTEMKM